MSFVEKVVQGKKIIFTVFLLTAVICAFLSIGVNVNYDMADYLPQEAPSTIALKEMEQEFTQSTPNIRVLVPEITIPEALATKKILEQVSGVEAVMWLDDIVSIYEPLEAAGRETVMDWYKDGSALYSLTINTDRAAAIVTELSEIVGEKGAVTGHAVDLASAQISAQNEVRQVMMYFVPMILLVLLLTTRSWFEPVLFLATIGVSIIINMGTNIIFGEISFVTQSVSPVLQLAVSMDYAIFLLSRFSHYRGEGMDIDQAMKFALHKSAPTIISSAATTAFGFLALTLMQFGIGADLGIVLAKGILFSLLSVMLFLPVLTLYTFKLIDKTEHRSFIPSFHKLGKQVIRLGIPVVILIGLLIIPSYLAQQQNDFIFGASAMGKGSRAALDAQTVENKFGRSTQMVLLVPRENWGKEQELLQTLQEIDHITSIISYQNAIGAQIPLDFIPQKELSNFISKKYSRIVITTNTENESSEAFAVVEHVRNAAAEYFSGKYHLLGSSVNVLDIRDTVTADNKIVNGVAILAIGLVLLVVFRSLTLPFILLLTIESAIWINLAVPYFMGSPLNYLGYLIISSVQLGATVDYGILFTQHYLDNRQTLPKKQAAVQTVGETAASILTPAGILVFAGLILYTISTNSIIQELGLVLGRGAALSAAMVLLFLPNILLLCDGIIPKTTLGLKFKGME